MAEVGIRETETVVLALLISAVTIGQFPDWADAQTFELITIKADGSIDPPTASYLALYQRRIFSMAVVFRCKVPDWGKHFLGIYYNDESGGKMLDTYVALENIVNKLVHTTK